MGGVSRVYRLLRLVTLLQGRRSYTAADLAAELDVSRRTVFRDLNMLELARIPYYFDEETRGYRISRHFFLPPVNLTFSEALALLVATERMRETGHMPLLDEARRAGMKIEGALPEAVCRHVGPMIERLQVRSAPAARHEGLDAMFDELLEAVTARRICRLVYLSFQEGKQLPFTVYPLRLVFIARAWYLIAHCPDVSAARTFKLARVRTLTVTDKTFTQPRDVDLDEYFGDAWCMIPEGKSYRVHLRFARKVAGNVAEVRWHRNQQTEFNDDGTLEFRVRVDGLGEISWWILGYGDQVEVVSPPALRTKIAAVARAVLAQYDGEEAPRVKAVLQRVAWAEVEVDRQVIGRIERGLLVYVGVAATDDAAMAAKLAEKIAGLRIFEDDGGKLNLSVNEVGGGVLAIPNFTLLADARRGRRPDFIDAARPEQAQPLYEGFLAALAQFGCTVAGGRFRAHMDIRSQADGPINILLEMPPRE